MLLLLLLNLILLPYYLLCLCMAVLFSFLPFSFIKNVQNKIKTSQPSRGFIGCHADFVALVMHFNFCVVESLFFMPLGLMQVKNRKQFKSFIESLRQKHGLTSEQGLLFLCGQIGNPLEIGKLISKISFELYGKSLFCIKPHTRWQWFNKFAKQYGRTLFRIGFVDATNPADAEAEVRRLANSGFNFGVVIHPTLSSTPPPTLSIPFQIGSPVVFISLVRLLPGLQICYFKEDNSTERNLTALADSYAKWSEFLSQLAPRQRNWL